MCLHMCVGVCWCVLSVDDDICFRGHRGYSAISSNHSWVLTEVFETAVVWRTERQGGAAWGGGGVLGGVTGGETGPSVNSKVSCYSAELSLSPSLSPSLPWMQRPSWLDQSPHPRSKSDGDVWEVPLQ